MAENTKQYWQGLEILNQEEEFLKHKDNEFAEDLPLEDLLSETSAATLKSNRRDFLKMFGFGISAATLAACRNTPVKKAIPYLIKPENITPGVSNYYASTCGGCSSSCGVLVKVRDGRPIKIEGNELTFNGEGTCAVGQATVLSLYDNYRLEGPVIKGDKTSWADIDSKISSALDKAKSSGKKVRLLSGTVNSPSTLSVINQFLGKFPSAKHISYDAVSAYGILAANQASFGKYALPTLSFDKANLIVGINCDFLGTWISPAEYAKQYAKGRKLEDGKETMSRHYQIESLLSLTGSNADQRATLRPGQEGAFAVALYNEIAKKAGQTVYANVEDPTPGKMAAKIANDLWSNQGRSLVVCGSNDPQIQTVINAINHILGNYGQTINIQKHSLQKRGNDIEFASLVNEMKQGEVDTLIIMGTNPVYDSPISAEFKSALAKVTTTISFADRLDETASEMTYVCPDNHFLESWNDNEAVKGHLTISQPTIPPIFDTRQVQQSLLIWSGSSLDYYDYIRQNWKDNVYPSVKGEGSFETFWNKTVHDGLAETGGSTENQPAFNANLAEAFSLATKSEVSDIQVVLYEKIGIRDGRMANNPWLQEFPDPISKAVWDNYAAVSNKFADDNGLKQGDLIELSASNVNITLPVLIQPGQAYGVIAVAMGYGRSENTGKTAAGIGKNAFPLGRVTTTGVRYHNTAAFTKLDGTYELAQTQTHHYYEGRPIIKETTLPQWQKDKKAGNPDVLLYTKEGMTPPAAISLWDNYDHSKGHHWGMVIDLNACTGCGSCIVACQAENNVAVVGKQEVLVRREMHWIRLDRYYSFKNASGTDVRKEREMDTVENFEDVEVVFQPMLCQHCDNAPCETVCPVLATVHSAEGLNQQVYNRCVGTRYCANNCPYKVRRFNWFEYAGNDKFDYTMYNSLNRMVLNPDVTVRSRGVMEKCSFCVQKIQEGKLTAKREGKTLEDGLIKTACQKVCPSNAIHFGDKNDPNSRVSQLLRNERSYKVLEEVKTLPNISYLTKVRNVEEVNS